MLFLLTLATIAAVVGCVHMAYRPDMDDVGWFLWMLNAVLIFLAWLGIGVTWAVSM